MQGGWQPPPGGGGYGPPGSYGAPPTAGGYGGAPSQMPGHAPPGPYGAPQGGPPGMQGITPQYGTYEFNPYENSIIEKTASRAKLWGIISTTIGALQIVGSCGMFASAHLATYLPAGIVAIVVGVTFIGAGNSLKAVVTTQGNDLMHLMQAMQKMSSAFIIEIVCAVIGFVLAVVAMIIVMFVLVAAAATS
ncbi:MAG: hypothetical protein J0I07_34000 [Myxococcales bacterium]|nr:hypothetical protein [Myxococcales bacterium]